MENKINILDNLTINKIAAGEVVERPSSVVKELMENSIDAKASKIIIEIQDGGRKSIRITDNGIGIPSSEVNKSFLRHATSKINKIDDLFDLYSLGFRGEALASISAVSKLEMITKTKSEPIGTRVEVEGGNILSKEPAGANNGTTLIIKDIFFNTPVRKKFLKSTHAETINISDLVNKLAIGNPTVQIKYINNNKPMLNTPGDGQLLSAIRSIYGKDITENLIEIELETKNFKVNGYIGNNNIYRSNKNLQHVYINKRFVKSKLILDSVVEAYKAIIPGGKHAVCFLNIKIDPAQIDVNIHPTKLEIKFENEQQIYTELKEYIRQRLLSTSLIGKYETYSNHTKNSEILPEIIKESDIYNLDKISERPISSFKLLDEVVYDDEELKNIGASNNGTYKSDNLTISNKFDFGKGFSIDDIEKLDTNINDGNSNKLLNETKQELFFEEEAGKFSLNDYKTLGVIFSTYIILEKNNSMYLLDQHAAHERVLYERYMKKFYSHDINLQLLLDPIVIELSNVDMLRVEKNIKVFSKFGFEVEIFGNNHIMIRSVPTIFGQPESEKFILQIIDSIDEIKNNYELKGDKFASMACRAAIKANDKINDLEINSLFSQMQECDNPFTCPHGRPIIVEISKKEIEKMFKRIM